MTGATAGSHAQVLSAFIAGSQSHSAPAEVIDAARLCLADWLAVAVGARDEEAGRVVRATVAGWNSHGRSTVLFGRPAAAPMAALANGTLAHCLDFDDTYVPGITHTSAPVWAAVLAAGQAHDADARMMLEAFVTGFEVSARAGFGLGQGLTSRGLHSTGVFGRIGAAAATAKLLGLDAGRAAHALATAATQASGLAGSFGTMAKPFHAGKAAMDGVLSAELAASGFVGAPSLLEPGGLDRALIQDGSLAFKTPEFNGWEILNNSFKPYAACHLVHPAVDAALASGIAPARIKRVRARVSPLAMQMTGNVDGRPQTPLAAKFDIRYCIALALHGRPVSAADFREPWVADAGVVETARRIEPFADASTGFATARLEIEHDAGEQKSILVPHAKGDPANPVRWDDMWSKFDGLVAPVLGAETRALFEQAQNFGKDASRGGTTLSDLSRTLEALRESAPNYYPATQASV